VNKRMWRRTRHPPL